MRLPLRGTGSAAVNRRQFGLKCNSWRRRRLLSVFTPDIGRVMLRGARELLRPRESGRARTFLATVVELEYLFTGGVMETPAWQTGSHARVKARVWENAVTACIVCLLSELKGHPKPRAAVANLMEKSGLLTKSRGGAVGSVGGGGPGGSKAPGPSRAARPPPPEPAGALRPPTAFSAPP